MSPTWRDADAFFGTTNRATEYRIERVSDFLLVPEDRLADCLKEFATCLEIARPAVALLREVEREMEGRAPVIEWPLRAFTWIDDGAHDITIGIEADGSVSASRPEGRASSEETTNG